MPRPATIHFDNVNGVRLTGILEAPSSGEPLAYAIFAHCFTCTKDFNAAYHISKRLAQSGIAVLRFDSMGLGASQGDLLDATYDGLVAEIQAAAAYLAAHHGPPALLIGHSIGGTAALMAAEKLPFVKAVTTIGAPADPAHLAGKLVRTGGALAAHGTRTPVNPDFLSGKDAGALLACLPRLECALLVMHAVRDPVVGIEEATRIFQTALHPKSFIALDTADHLLSHKADAAYAGDLIGAWAMPYTGRAPDDA